MFEQIDPIIREVIAELKEKNPFLGEGYENDIVQRLWAFRNRLNPTSQDSVEVKEASQEIARRMKIIDKWFKKQIFQWDKIKKESPDLSLHVFDSMDNMDLRFNKWKSGVGTWEEVDHAVLNYAKAWREIAVAYR